MTTSATIFLVVVWAIILSVCGLAFRTLLKAGK